MRIRRKNKPHKMPLKFNKFLVQSGKSLPVFIQSKIITDIRPIYSLNIEESPKKGIVIHNLHIHFSSGSESEHKDVYFTLDSEELKELKEVLLRAEKKEVSLNSIFEKANIENLS